ncbi:hypothetical protein M5C99_05385 [Acidovorax sp. NCPPB 2350]|nr:hypothetical protein M5C99_05385 [Acidovorax sp. NCPPB 2350]
MMIKLRGIMALVGFISGVAHAGTDYFFVSNQPVGNISGRTIFNAQHYPAWGYGKLIFSLDNPTGNANGLPSNDVGVPISGWDLGDFSGLPVPAPQENYQRGLAGTSYGGTTVSMHDVNDGGTLSPRFGAMINAYNLPWTQAVDANGNPRFLPNGKPVPHHTNISGAILQYAPSASVEHKPFVHGPSSVFNLSMMIQAPSVVTVGDSRAQLGVNFTLVDMTDPRGSYFWFQTNALDHPSGDEPYAPTETIGWDVATASFVVNSSFKNGTTYTTKDPASAFSTTQPWTGWKWFGYSVSYSQIQTAINHVNQGIQNSAACTQPNPDPAKCRLFTTSPENLKIGLIYLGAEFARSNPNGAGYLGYSTYGWWAYSNIN